MVEVRSGVRLAIQDNCRLGPAVILSHGLAGFKELWRDTVAALSQAGYRTITYDHRGHGESEDPPPPWTISGLADDLASILDRLDVARACVIGHSMGGRTLFQFALEHPDRIWGLVPVAAQSEAPPSPYREALMSVRNITIRDGLTGFLTAFLATGEIPERVNHDSAFAKQFQLMFARNRPEPLIAALDAILAMPELTPRLAEIAVPVLTVVGERDAPFRKFAAVYEEIIPLCRSIVIPNCHHYPMTDQPTAFASALVDFLECVRPGK